MMSLLSVENFIEEHGDKLPTVAQSGVGQRLVVAIGALRGHVTDQTGKAVEAQGLTRKAATLRTALVRDHMRPIARIARADLATVPEFQELRVPKANVSPAKVYAAALGMAQAAQVHVSTFVAAGLPVDFIAQLTTAADTMIAALENRASAQGKRRGATTGLSQMIREGRNVVHVLDALITTALQNDPVLLANWKTIARTRTKRAVTSPSVAAPSGTPPVAA